MSVRHMARRLPAQIAPPTGHSASQRQKPPHEIAAIARIRFLLLCWKVSTYFLVGQHTSEALYPIVGTAFGRFGALPQVITRS